MRNYKISDINSLKTDFDIAFSALPASAAKSIEKPLRQQGKFIFSNASFHRMDKEVPILIPEINEKHSEFVKLQKDRYSGFIVTNSNCSVSGISIFLKELSQKTPIKEVYASTYQAISGAGFKGLKESSFARNVVPFIFEEEEKMEQELLKILASIKKQSFIPPKIKFYANCARVDVIDGHLASLTVKLGKDAKLQEIRKALNSVKSPLDKSFHSAPQPHLQVTNNEKRPQPKLDSLNGMPASAKGMVVHIGRLRLTDNRILRAFVLAHNTIRGGAGGSILNAEFLDSLGML